MGHAIGRNPEGCGAIVSVESEADCGNGSLNEDILRRSVSGKDKGSDVVDGIRAFKRAVAFCFHRFRACPLLNRKDMGVLDFLDDAAASVLVREILACKRNLATFSNLVFPLVPLCHAVNVDMDIAVFLIKVEVTVCSIDIALYNTGKLVNGCGIGQRQELRNGDFRGVLIVRFIPCVGIVGGSILRDAVQAVQIGLVLDGLRGFAFVVHDLAIEDNLIANLYLSLAFLPFLIIKIEQSVSQERGLGILFVRN